MPVTENSPHPDAKRFRLFFKFSGAPPAPPHILDVSAVDIAEAEQLCRHATSDVLMKKPIILGPEWVLWKHYLERHDGRVANWVQQ